MTIEEEIEWKLRLIGEHEKRDEIKRKQRQIREHEEAFYESDFYKKHCEGYVLRNAAKAKREIERLLKEYEEATDPADRKKTALYMMPIFDDNDNDFRRQRTWAYQRDMMGYPWRPEMRDTLRRLDMEAHDVHMKWLEGVLKEFPELEHTDEAWAEWVGVLREDRAAEAKAAAEGERP